MTTPKTPKRGGTMVNYRIPSNVHEAAKVLAPYLDQDFGAGDTTAAALRLMTIEGAKFFLSHYKLPGLQDLKPGESVLSEEKRPTRPPDLALIDPEREPT